MTDIRPNPLACSTNVGLNDEEEARVSRESWLKVKQSSSEVPDDHGNYGEENSQ